ncbi:site-specific DNA-methyltransferase [Paenibacillus spiritus]|uniref:Site-specific DNA-methyltransferase n=1 Tax=Paenibacillus spiritus TaxID=2496557 RepID=A0A5J5GD69_9BACL|nr:site-specific DNA-methyltransferase [Paenibacillus spiritus]KAA9005900.1 site-specific DNA-methyltransferase [Paenibacillus spiritus]
MINNYFYKALSITSDTELKAFSKNSGIKLNKLKYYAEEMIYPHRGDLEKILAITGLSEIELQLKLGHMNSDLRNLLSLHSSQISEILKLVEENKTARSTDSIQPVFKTQFGQLFQNDCMALIESLPHESVDLVFADPPFNLNKEYESGINDKLSKREYLEWTERWVLGCIDLLKEGGSLFIWISPTWGTHIAETLNKHLTFKHWIAADIKYRLPIQNRLYPAHYALLYYTKGDKPNTFNGERLPLEICRHCGGDIRDYGGYKDKLNPLGINLSDIWYDLSPVRHSKYKTRTSNELPLKLLERVISLASNEGDTIFDPFGGSGTTFIVSEILKRKWIGSEIGPVNTIRDRFRDIEFHEKVIRDIQKNKNTLFTEEVRKIRIKNGKWLPETLKN